MYDINLKNVKKGRNIFYIFLAFGVLFLIIIGGVLLSSVNKSKKMDSTVEAYYIEIIEHYDSDGTMYSPKYHYEVDGKKLICDSSSSSSSYPNKEKNKVYYDSKNPEYCITEYDKSGNFILLIFLLLPLVFIAVGVINIKKVNKRVSLIIELNQKGRLVKNLPYRLENSNFSVNGVPVQKPVVEYTLPSGVTVNLYGDPRHDGKYFDADGFVDLLIDESNPENYFIDFEINRLTGNLPSDYYQLPSQQQ